MKHEPVINKKLLATVCASVVGAYAVATIALGTSALINYDTQDYYSKHTLERVTRDLQSAKQMQDCVYEKIAQQSYDTLHKDTKYQNMIKEADRIAGQLSCASYDDKTAYSRLVKKYDDITDKIALREEELRCKYINKHPEVRHINARLNSLERYHASVAKECAIRDSIEQIPRIQRIKSNWRKIKTDMKFR